MKYLLTLTFFILFLGSFILSVYLHEQVHVRIYEDYGINTRVEWFSHFPDVVTMAEQKCPNDACISANNNNDAIAYNLTGFYLILGGGLFYIIYLLEELNEGRKNETIKKAN